MSSKGMELKDTQGGLVSNRQIWPDGPTCLKVTYKAYEFGFATHQTGPTIDIKADVLGKGLTSLFTSNERSRDEDKEVTVTIPQYKVNGQNVPFYLNIMFNKNAFTNVYLKQVSATSGRCRFETRPEGAVSVRSASGTQVMNSGQ
jgi:hypothetical protein